MRSAPWALFRYTPNPGVEAEVRMDREAHDAAVRAGEACGCDCCLNCRARDYWREGGLYNAPGEYPLDPEFDLVCTCPSGPEIVDGQRHTYAGPRRGELLCGNCGLKWEGGP